MEGFVKILPEELENSVKSIGKDWMLLTVRDKENNKVNAMTASWGAVGVLWNKSICICFVRPQRYTYELLKNESRFSIAFLPEERRDALRFCGRESGRDCDKLEKCKLTTAEENGVPYIQEANTVLICKKLYEDDIKENCFLDSELLSNYKSGDYHRMYVCEIKEAYKKEDK